MERWKPPTKWGVGHGCFPKWTKSLGFSPKWTESLRSNHTVDGKNPAPHKVYRSFKNFSGTKWWMFFSINSITSFSHVIPMWPFTCSNHFYWILLDPFVNRRTILLLMLVQAIDGFFVLEQPSSSLLPRHDRFQWLVYQWYKINLKVACLVLFWKPNLLTV